MSHQHPDPEGHLTDITISAVRDLRDEMWHDYLEKPPGADSEFSKGYDAALKEYLPWLNSILEPWGESIDLDFNLYTDSMAADQLAQLRADISD
jgi:hypothetical protein